VGGRVEIIKPDSAHWQGLSDVANGIEYAFLKLGVEHHRDRVVVFNAHRDGLFYNGKDGIGSEDIIYNAEQVPTVPYAELSPGWQRYVDLLRTHVTWDYSVTNIERLKRLGVDRVVHCRVGWWPGLEYPRATIIPEHVLTGGIDVLFIGSMNERRAMLIYDLSRKLNVKTAFGVYGIERDVLLTRAKIVLNVHFYDNPIHEIFRTSHAVANGKCVVTEDGGCDPELEEFAERAMERVHYGEIVERCELLLRAHERRDIVGKIGREVLKEIDQVEEVRRALSES
jgi:hypothetical protein